MGLNHFSNDHNIRPAGDWCRGFFSPSGQLVMWPLVLLLMWLLAAGA